MLRSLLPLLAIGLFAQQGLPAQGKSRPKHVLLIVADDLGLDLNCYGNKAIRMPHLDGLAAKGTRFSRAYATVASCSPSRASIYTGLFTHQNGQYGLAHAGHKQQCFDHIQSLANLLKAVGYFTGILAKIHVLPDSSFDFDLKLGGGRNIRTLAKNAAAFLRKRDDKPFFLVCGFVDPHRARVGYGNEEFAKDPAEKPYDPKEVIVPAHLPDNAATRKDLAEYYQSASRMDRGVGLILAELAKAGVLEDTLVIFISDNGIPFPGAKTTLYNAGIHLPLLMAGPGVPRGHVNDTLVSYVDLAPTILDFAEAAGPKKYKLPGRSLLPILKEKDAKGWDEVYASHQFHEITMYYPMRSIITRKYKLILNIAPEREYPFPSDLWASPTWQSVRKGNLTMMGKKKVQEFLHRPKEELYDLSVDPDELHNLAADPKHAGVLADLRRRLRAWQAATNDPWTIVYREEDPKWNR